MGLDTSHDAFHGAYSAFNRFRQIVAKAMGGTFPEHESATFSDGTPIDPKTWYWGPGFNAEKNPGLLVFFNHSDCDGEISPEDCVRVADELEALLPEIEKLDDGGGGHIESQGGYAAVTRLFIGGCRAAAEDNEPLVFH